MTRTPYYSNNIPQIVQQQNTRQSRKNKDVKIVNSDPNYENQQTEKINHEDDAYLTVTQSKSNESDLGDSSSGILVFLF